MLCRYSQCSHEPCIGPTPGNAHAAPTPQITQHHMHTTQCSLHNNKVIALSPLRFVSCMPNLCTPAAVLSRFVPGEEFKAAQNTGSSQRLRLADLPQTTALVRWC